MQFLPERGEDHQLPVFINKYLNYFHQFWFLGSISGHLRVSDLILDQSNFTL